MKQSVNFYNFERAFKRCERENFSYDGLKALFSYLEEYEENTGEELELDVIALCCEFSEYDSLNEYNESYDKDHKTIDEIGEDTLLIKINDKSFIIQEY